MGGNVSLGGVGVLGVGVLDTAVLGAIGEEAVERAAGLVEDCGGLGHRGLVAGGADRLGRHRELTEGVPEFTAGAAAHGLARIGGRGLPRRRIVSVTGDGLAAGLGQLVGLAAVDLDRGDQALILELREGGIDRAGAGPPGAGGAGGEFLDELIAIARLLGDQQQRIWYARQTIEQGWSRSILIHQIDSGLYERQGRALTNFERTLPPARSDLARQLLKDPYNFDFLGLGIDAQERDLEKGLLLHVRDFLLELGVGFAFVGSQYHLSIADQDYYLDVLFYHLKLRCFVVIDLKIGEFKPEDAGKMNFYLSALDDILRHPDDQPSIGLILCKSKNQVIVEYTLRDMRKPIGVSEYQLTQALPEYLQTSLPTIEELEEALKEPSTDEDETAQG